MNTRVLLADDHKLFLSGLSAVLQKVDWIDVVDTASDGADALEKIVRHALDIAVVDISMPKMNGIELARQVKALGLSTKVLMLSMHLDRRMITEALSAGAIGYVLKESDESELIKAIGEAQKDANYFSPDALRLIIADYLSLVEKHARGVEKESSSLSNRELQVLKLLVAGWSVKDVTKELHIGKTTVDTHRRNIMKKLSCENLADLTRYAIREGLYDIR